MAASSSSSSTAAPSTPLVYYDIGSTAPHTPYAVNPCKARYALNFKAVPFSTQWVELTDISAVRIAVGAPAVRKFADGSDYHTLPMLTDATTGAVVGDSFDIATYLQTTYPDSGAGDLFPPAPKLGDYKSPFADQTFIVPLSALRGGHTEYGEFNRHVDATFTAHVILMCHGIPMNPATADKTKAEFVRRAGVGSWDDFAITADARDKTLASLRESTKALADMWAEVESGPFLAGDKASYADCILGGWLRMMSVTLEEWDQVREWHGGVFGRLFDALAKYADVK